MKLFYQIVGLITVVFAGIAINKMLGLSDTGMLVGCSIGSSVYVLTQINRG